MITKNEEQAVEQLKKAVSGMNSEEAFMSLMFAAADVLEQTAVKGAADRFWEAVRRFTSEQRAKEPNKHCVTIHWGSDVWQEAAEDVEFLKERTETKQFATEAELDAYRQGVDDGNGWMDYFVCHEHCDCHDFVEKAKAVTQAPGN
ncbi:MAG TPA: hypothetical protein VE957_10265 [Terriglobales bacterium]|nr:hypothetical protein [Terriglobales bacterium]